MFCPVLVQGEDAAAQLTAAVKLMNAQKAADVIIIGRGGGSGDTASQIAAEPDRLVNGRALLVYIPLVALAIWAGIIGGLWLYIS